MLQLADCGLEDLKTLQACNRLWEGIPLNYCKGGRKNICNNLLDGDLPKGHGMTVSRDSVTVLYIIR